MADLIVGDEVAVGDAFGAEGDGEFDVGVGLMKAGVEPGAEPSYAGGTEELHGLVQAEAAGGGIGVDIGNGSPLGYAGEHFVRQEAEIAVGVIGEFGGKSAGPEPGGDDRDGTVLEVFEDADAFHFAGVIETVSSFGFEGGRSMTEALMQRIAGLQFEAAGGEAAHVANLGVEAIVKDAALFERSAEGSHLEFIDTRGAADQMGMRIDEAGHNDAAIGFDDFGIFGFREVFESAAGSDRLDSPVLYKNGAIGN